MIGQNMYIHVKLILMGIGMCLFTSLFGQTKTDAELYAIWKDTLKPEIVRLEAIWERMDIDSLPNQEPEWWKKWGKETKEAIELAIKNNKKGYLPLFYMSTLEDCANNMECMCNVVQKVIESAKVANDSKLPIIFNVYSFF